MKDNVCKPIPLMNFVNKHYFVIDVNVNLINNTIYMSLVDLQILPLGKPRT